MTELKLTQLPNGQVLCEMEGEESEIAQMICRAMAGSISIASMICGIIPTFLDVTGIDRSEYCETVMKAHGYKKDKPN